MNFNFEQEFDWDLDLVMRSVYAINKKLTLKKVNFPGINSRLSFLFNGETASVFFLDTLLWHSGEIVDLPESIDKQENFQTIYDFLERRVNKSIDSF